MKIMVLSGKRGGYDAMLPMMKLMEADSSIELQLVVTDQHLRSLFGETIKDITIPIYAQIPISWDNDDSSSSKALDIGTLICQMVSILTSATPDILIVYGDRGESLAAAIAAKQMNIPVMHLQAGDTSGSIDNSFRWAISHLSTLLFSSCRSSTKAIKNRNFSSRMIHQVGDHHIDSLITTEKESVDTLLTSLNIENKENLPIYTLLLHSDSLNPSRSCLEIDIVFQGLRTALLYKDWIGIGIYPCSDPGYQAIIDRLEEEVSNNSNFYTYPNLQSNVFHQLLMHSSFLIGNSSCGIIETPYLKTPSINIGDRQKGRAKSGWTIDCPFLRAPIEESILYSLDRGKANLPYTLYGNGTAGIQTLNKIKEWANVNYVY